jgi:hypothetical protein
MPTPPSVSTPGSPPGASTSALVGAWRLIAWEAHAPDGTVAQPWPDALGSLIYSADGHMSGHIMRRDRPPFAGVEALRGTDQESAAAMRSYIAYAGTYRREGDTVIHRVELSLFPNWVGSEQRRDIAWEGDRLVLSTPPMPFGGAPTVHRLVWERTRPTRS